MIRTFIFSLLIVCLFGCNNDEQIYDDFQVTSYKEYDHLRRLVKEQKLTLTNKPIGSEVTYNPENGKMIKWKWYDTNYVHPLIVVYYENERFIGFKGNPFIGGYQYEGKTAIEMIAPPKVKYLMGYKDFLGDSLIRRIAYEPGVKNGKSSVLLDEHQFEPGHKYYVYFYFMNERNRIQDSAFTELLQ